jgi:hypothetical protein
MNDLLFPALVLIPHEALGGFLMIMIVLGGICIMFGATRQGKTLIGTAIAVPLVTVVVEALCNELFAVLPLWAVKVVAWLILILTYLAVFASVMRLLLGKEAWDNAKGNMASDAMKGVFKVAFSKWLLPVWAVLLIYLWW